MLSAAIQEKALELGFAGCGFSRAEALPGDARRLEAWLQKGCHARMGYMANHLEKRTDPTKLVEGARTVISLLYNYYTDLVQADPDAPVLSKYAYGRDYHFVLKDKMHMLFAFIKTMHPEAEGRVFVDSAPVLDRAWALRAGLGWIGKNSNLISRTAGSFVFIGEIILNLELDYNQVPESDFCGSCTLCIEACPTQAILANRTLDSERCISYQTIENRGEISPEIEDRLRGRVFGCDICQDVCPWNRKATRHREAAFEPDQRLLNMSGDDWQEMSPEEFGQLFHESAVQRAGYTKIKRTLASLQKKQDPGEQKL
ncbi:MAG: tRNA epoxyqueuosine(34) reductase QueG [Bacteroidales bacterium]|nr:tRNA epoxyqueuosine(34) reductase QueG [Bacteroidales bacterium]